jgi:phosphatidylglycerol:prolipoprotein diacylglycerol transferase
LLHLPEAEDRMTPGAEVEWGIRPTLFHILGWGVPSYSFFMVLAVGVGLLLFWREAARQREAGERTVMVLLGAVFGGVLGSKIPMIMLYWRDMAAQWPDATLLVTSRSITGGLVGGALGVFAAKRWFGITGRRGNLFVPGIAAGMAIGRLGCFLRGCCYGNPASLPWAVDFGDGVPRHPTQLYEMVFMLAMLAAGWIAVRRWPEPAGLVFKAFMLVYFAFRFMIEFIRDEPLYGMGLTLFQWISVAMVVFYAIDLMMLLHEGKRSRVDTAR